MVPVGESHSLILKWQVDFLEDLYKKKPVEYISHLLGHEGENSLLSLLIDENLAYELSSGSSEIINVVSEISVSISLTQHG